MLKAVIFDMDGVLIDSEPLYMRGWQQAVKEYGGIMDTVYYNQISGSSKEYQADKVIKDFNIKNCNPSELSLKVMSYKDKIIEEEGLELIPYVKELIIDLTNNGIQLAIASSSYVEEIENVVKTFDFSQYFSVILSGQQVVNPKPAPDIFIKTREELGVSNDESVIIEDSFNGVVAAKKANIPVIGFENVNFGNQDLSYADARIKSFKDINYEYIYNFLESIHSK